MDSIDNECTGLKKAYEACFNSWYTSEFVTGSAERKTPCESLFLEYRKCLDLALKERKIDVMLDEHYRQHATDSLH